MTVFDVVVVGAGVFGLSTAVQLARSNYKVLVIDKFQIPSPLSAAYDYNKIVRLEYNDEVYAALAVESMGYWYGDDCKFLPRGLLHNCYSHCGRLSVLQDKKTSRFAFDNGSLQVLQTKFNRCKDVELHGELTCGGRFPQFTNSQRYDEIRYNPDCGIGFARESLVAMKRYAETLGVSFHEHDGVLNVSGETVQCESGERFYGKKIIVACGANTVSLLPMQGKINATGLYVGHVQLTDNEYEKLKNIPVVFNSSLGYLFPPDKDTKILKICTTAMSAYDSVSEKSKPIYKSLQPELSPSIPIEAIVRIRTVLGKYLPDLVFDPLRKSKLRNIIDCKICWISDTSNSDFIVDKVPNTKNVYVCCGDSGHAYKFLPNIGKYVQQKIEGTLAPALAHKWRYRDSNWQGTEIEWRFEPKKKALQEIEWYLESYGRPKL
ncbi:unnamed protein product [Kluyveromyces dobzhanskii CBS 2104]|uniref:WGS project CCBQ000000000 data, contig 00106 n=1 Tax=Kluyveromyces dobzhanskii CBS 2104 TaxID=1427455 RepID=A0A0A8L8L5_9SACH|nr:unnamed protein product [Kluyveromyces dobzhanskii CBS 2104]